MWPKANGPEQLQANGQPSGTALAYYNPKNTIREDFGTARADYNLRDQDRFFVSYMNDTGNSIIPLVDPLFASGLRLGAQVASVEETHVISPTMLNTFRAGFSRGAFNYDAASYAPFPPGTSFVQGGQPGAITISGGGITAAGGT